MSSVEPLISFFTFNGSFARSGAAWLEPRLSLSDSQFVGVARTTNSSFCLSDGKLRFLFSFFFFCKVFLFGFGVYMLY